MLTGMEAASLLSTPATGKRTRSCTHARGHTPPFNTTFRPSPELGTGRLPQPFPAASERPGLRPGRHPARGPSSLRGLQTPPHGKDGLTQAQTKGSKQAEGPAPGGGKESRAASRDLAGRPPRNRSLQVSNCLPNTGHLLVTTETSTERTRLLTLSPSSQTDGAALT